MSNSRCACVILNFLVQTCTQAKCPEVTTPTLAAVNWHVHYPR